MTSSSGLKFGDGFVYADCIKTSMHTVRWSDVEYFKFKQVASVVNAMSLYIEYLIVVFTKNYKIDLYEKIDNRGIVLITPLKYLFNREKRRNFRRKTLEERLNAKIRFDTIVRHIQTKTGKAGNDLSEIQERYLLE
ncbi:MAG TPA: hypothetical protein PLB05_06460 [Candidatus Omnitrophota bacterium]|nr:hypothetical protein [Candidatus Omnitrophota bacterium]